MASTAAMAAMALTNTNMARTIVEAHGSDERRERIGMYFPTTPSMTRDQVRYMAYQAELIAGLAEMYETLVSQPAAPKRGLGRPRKDQSTPTSQDADMEANGTD